MTELYLIIIFFVTRSSIPLFQTFFYQNLIVIINIDCYYNKTKITVILEMSQEFDAYLFYILKTIFSMIIFTGHFKVIFDHFFLIGGKIFFRPLDREIQEQSDKS